jgi:hypothetical protein
MCYISLYIYIYIYIFIYIERYYNQIMWIIDLDFNVVKKWLDLRKFIFQINNNNNNNVCLIFIYL